MLANMTLEGLGLSFVSYIIAEALRVLSLWREDNEKDSFLDRVIAVSAVAFYVIGFIGVITLGALHNFEHKRLFRKHDQDIKTMHTLVEIAQKPWQAREHDMKLYHPEYAEKCLHDYYSADTFQGYVREVMDHLELGNPYK